MQPGGVSLAVRGDNLMASGKYSRSDARNLMLRIDNPCDPAGHEAASGLCDYSLLSQRLDIVADSDVAAWLCTQARSFLLDTKAGTGAKL